MKKFITIASVGSLLAVIIIPSVALAVWWNPFTWFQKPALAPVAQTIQLSTVPATASASTTVSVPKTHTQTSPKPAIVTTTQATAPIKPSQPIMPQLYSDASLLQQKMQQVDALNQKVAQAQNDTASAMSLYAGATGPASAQSGSMYNVQRQGEYKVLVLSNAVTAIQSEIQLFTTLATMQANEPDQASYTASLTAQGLSAKIQQLNTLDQQMVSASTNLQGGQSLMLVGASLTSQNQTLASISALTDQALSLQQEIVSTASIANASMISKIRH